MSLVFKVSVWVIAVAVIFQQSSELWNPILIQSGLLRKPIKIFDICDCDFLPVWMLTSFGCKPKQIFKKKIDKLRPLLSLRGDLLKNIQEKTKDKTMQDKLLETLTRFKNMVVPKNFKMPCIGGNCDLGDKVKSERKVYEDMFLKKKKKSKSDNEAPIKPSV